MTLGNMRELGVQKLIASCLNDACRHIALIDVSRYPADTEVPWFDRGWSAPSAAAVEQDRRAPELEFCPVPSRPAFGLCGVGKRD